jgi:hypothetical protein
MKETLEKPSAPKENPAIASTPEQTYAPIERKTATFDPKVLQLLLDGVHAEIRNSVKRLIIQSEFRYYDGNDVAIYRKHVLAWTIGWRQQESGEFLCPDRSAAKKIFPSS